MRDAIIVDVDGTLADVSGIRHYVDRELGNRNFEKFHAAASLVHPHPEVVDLVTTLHGAGLAVLVVTSRKDRWRSLTRTWLEKWQVPFDELHMRGDDDQRKDVEVKRDLLGGIRERYRVTLAIDDNPAVIALWNDERIPVVTWPGWPE